MQPTGQQQVLARPQELHAQSIPCIQLYQTVSIQFACCHGIVIYV